MNRIATGLILASAALASAAATPAAAQNQQDCITRHRGVSQQQPTQRGVYEHKVYLTNGCSKTVDVRVCYRGTNSCVQPDVRPGQERITLLGIKRGEPDFRYEFTVVR